MSFLHGIRVNSPNSVILTMLLETLNNNNVRTAEKLRQSVIGVLNTDAASYNLSTDEGLNAYFESGHAAESKISKQDVQTLLREDTPQLASVHTENILKVQSGYNKDQGGAAPLNLSMPRGSPEMINITNEIRNVPSSGSGMSGYVMPSFLRGNTPQLASAHTESVLNVQPRYKTQGNAVPLNNSVPRGNQENIHLENDVRGVQSSSSGISEYVMPFETTSVNTGGANTSHDTLAVPDMTADKTGEAADSGYALQFSGRQARDTE